MERVLAEKFKELDTMNTQVKVCKQSFKHFMQSAFVDLPGFEFACEILLIYIHVQTETAQELPVLRVNYTVSAKVETPFPKH